MKAHWPLGHASLCFLGVLGCLAGCVDGAVVASGTPPPAATVNPAGPYGTAPPGTPVAGFEVTKTHIKLLPFSVRLDKIAAATGLPVSDPAYNTLRENRLLLGDHDYANAKPPLESWSAARLVTWVESVRPVCQSPAVLARLSPMPGRFPALIDAAHGRPPLPHETAALAEEPRGLSLPPAKLVETVCVSVLSSLEFVAQ
jgi:hypothetical protein